MSAKRGFILINTGAPISTQEADLRRYFKEVSHDHHRTSLPSSLDAAVHPNRADETSKAYRKIWTQKGSPLVHTCKKIRNTLKANGDTPVEIGMLYGAPAISRGIGKLLDENIDELGVLPMFPQYSTETFQDAIDKVIHELRIRKSNVQIRTALPFYSDSSYVDTQAEKLKEVDEHILFSYRGLSVHHLKSPDKHGHCLSSMECCHEPSAAHDTCYRFQCLKTTRLIANVAGLSDTQYSVAFSSRCGSAKCIEPYTEDVLRKLPAHGHTQLAVICPANFCDSIETLEEIEIRGRDTFMNAGGESFRMLPALNASESGIQCLERIMNTPLYWETPAKSTTNKEPAVMTA